MADEVITEENVLDENTRRYYLDAMGIQCWQSLETDNEAATKVENENEINRDVTSSQSLNNEVNWLQLETSIQQCSKCPRQQSRKQAIVGRGNKSAELMFVLLSPNVIDDRSATICGGDSGGLLTKMLAAIDIAIDDVYITSLLKCHSADTSPISSDEVHQCNTHLSQQIELIRPKVLIVLGEAASQILLQENLPLDDLRENCNKDKSINLPATGKYQFNGITLFVSYSPDELLQNAENKRKAWSDLQALKKII